MTFNRSLIAVSVIQLDQNPFDLTRRHIIISVVI
jgi:hypothetical protein